MKRVALCLSAIMIAGLFTGCGGNDDKAESGSTTATTTTAATTATTAATTNGTTTTETRGNGAEGTTTDDGSLMSDLEDAGDDLMSDTESIISNAGERMR